MKPRLKPVRRSKASWFAGYAAGAGYALSAIKKLAAAKETALGSAPAQPGEDS